MPNVKKKKSYLFLASCHVMLLLMLLMGCTGGRVPAPSEDVASSTAQALTIGHSGPIACASACSAWTSCSTGYCVPCGTLGLAPCAISDVGTIGCEGWTQSSTLSANLSTALDGAVAAGQSVGTCQPCGQGGEAPCVQVDATHWYGSQESECQNGQAAYLLTSPTGTGLVCSACGAAGQAPCSDSGLCSAGTVVQTVQSTTGGWTEICTTCGDVGQPLCNANPPCSTKRAPLNGKCQVCGIPGGPLCPDSGCNTGLVAANGICNMCGADGEMACAGNTCDSTPYMLASFNGVCQVCGGLNESICPGGQVQPCGVDPTQPPLKAGGPYLADVGGICQPLQQKTWSCPHMSTSGIQTTTDELVVANTGNWIYSGGINSNSIIGGHYGVGIILTNPATGLSIAAAAQGDVGASDGSNNNSNFISSGVDPTVPAQWASMTNATAACNLGISIDGWATTEQILLAIGIAAAAVLCSATCGQENSGNEYVCGEQDSDGNYHFRSSSSPCPTTGSTEGQ